MVAWCYNCGCGNADVYHLGDGAIHHRVVIINMIIHVRLTTGPPPQWRREELPRIPVSQATTASNLCIRSQCHTSRYAGLKSTFRCVRVDDKDSLRGWEFPCICRVRPGGSQPGVVIYPFERFALPRSSHRVWVLGLRSGLARLSRRSRPSPAKHSRSFQDPDPPHRRWLRGSCCDRAPRRKCRPAKEFRKLEQDLGRIAKWCNRGLCLSVQRAFFSVCL